MFIDLHTHSTFSDGLLSPSELIAASKQIEDKYSVILAMTDHDTLLGLPEFLKEAKHQGIMGISGLELSVNYEHPVNRREENVHILCYGIDRGSGEFKRFLGNLVKMRKLRCETIVKKFNALNLNVKLSIDDVFEKVSVSCGRPHVAMLLMEKGVVKSIEEAFERFLDIGRPCYVPKQT
ncbi:MAG TPA: PHP domain-containing protein, partial [Candidatus Hodarchaeales archaeon]|nr:PHP domain-containing protein [Candidatus Hodarchaeales archaeon]